jgi:arylsulfatase A-like enzyme
VTALARAALAAALGLAMPGCGEAAPGSPIRHVVVVVLDATHAAHLGCYGGPAQTTPFVDELAARGVRFERALSNATWTLPSTVSLMTGLAPERHGIATAQDAVTPDLVLLAERFAQAGFETAACVQMIFASDRHGLDRGFDGFDYVGPGDSRAMDRLRARLTDWFATRGEQRSLLYVHLRRPHSPYNPPAEALAPFEAGHPLADGSADDRLRFVDNQDSPELSERERERLVQLYRGNLRAVDAELAALLPVERLGTDTLLVVTSDHGEGLGEHGDYGHGRGLHPEHVAVPLILVGPGLTPRVIDEPVGTIDVLPTLCELVGLSAPEPCDGVSLAPLLRDESLAARTRPLLTSARRYPGEASHVAAVDGRWFVRLDATGTLTVHDLASPAEPGTTSPPGLVERLRPHLVSLQRWEPRPVPRERAVLEPGDEEDLRALGYVR